MRRNNQFEHISEIIVAYLVLYFMGVFPATTRDGVNFAQKGGGIYFVALIAIVGIGVYLNRNNGLTQTANEAHPGVNSNSQDKLAA